MQLSFTNPELEPPKYTIDECKERGKTYAAPLYVERRVHEPPDR